MQLLDRYTIATKTHICIQYQSATWLLLRGLLCRAESVHIELLACYSYIINALKVQLMGIVHVIIEYKMNLLYLNRYQSY